MVFFFCSVHIFRGNDCLLPPHCNALECTFNICATNSHKSFCLFAFVSLAVSVSVSVSVFLYLFCHFCFAVYNGYLTVRLCDVTAPLRSLSLSLALTQRDAACSELVVSPVTAGTAACNCCLQLTQLQ